jgi:hypothetical protein
MNSITETRKALAHISKIEKANMQKGFDILPVPDYWKSQPTLSFLNPTDAVAVCKKIAENHGAYKGKGIPKPLWEVGFLAKNGLEPSVTKKTLAFALCNTLDVAVTLTVNGLA